MSTLFYFAEIHFLKQGLTVDQTEGELGEKL